MKGGKIVNNKKTLIIFTILFLFILAGAGFAYGKLAENAGTQNNFTHTAEEKTEPAKDTEEHSKIEAPDFTVTDWEGNSVNLSDFEGKPVVINFWATWCGYCQMEMPDFENKYKEYEGKINFLMVNVTDGNRETVDTAKSYIEKSGYTFPVYFDTELDASNTYGAYSLPMTLFIDADGYAIAQATGMIGSELLQKGIDMIYMAE